MAGGIAMTQAAEQMLDQMLELPANDRFEVAIRALESVTGRPAPALNEEWMEEIHLRMEELRTGRADCMPAEEFMKQMRAQYLNAR